MPTICSAMTRIQPASWQCLPGEPHPICLSRHIDFDKRDHINTYPAGTYLRQTLRVASRKR